MQSNSLPVKVDEDSQQETGNTKGEHTSQPGHGNPIFSIRKLISVFTRSLISLLLICGSIVVFISLNTSRPAPVREKADSRQPFVETVAVQASHSGIDFDVDGVVIPYKRIEVPVEVAGVVAERSEKCRIGHFIEKGDVLVQIASREYQLEVRQLEEQLEQAEASLNELELNIASRERKVAIAQETQKIKSRDLARMKQLNSRNVVTDTDVDASRLEELESRNSLQLELDQLEVEKATRKRLKSSRDLAAVQLERARFDEERCTVRSPISGVITQEPAEEGVFLQRGATVATVQDVSTMEIRCSLNMRQMKWLLNSKESHSTAARDGVTTTAANMYRIPPTPVTVQFTVDGTEYSWAGTLVSFDGAEVDRQTRLVSCRVYVRQSKGQASQSRSNSADQQETHQVSLMTGMFVKLLVHSRPQTELLQIPEAALNPGDDVWVVSPTKTVQDARAVKDSKMITGSLQRIPVRIAHTVGKTVLVYAGESLNAGDRVVVSPLTAPVNGILVQYGVNP